MRYLASLIASSMKSHYSIFPIKTTVADDGIFAYAAHERKVGRNELLQFPRCKDSKWFELRSISGLSSMIIQGECSSEKNCW